MRHDITHFYLILWPISLLDFMRILSFSWHPRYVYSIHFPFFQLSFMMKMKWQTWFICQKQWYMVAAWIQSLRPIPMAAAVQDQIVCNFLNVTGGYMENVLCVCNKGIKFWKKKKKIQWARIRTKLWAK